MARKKLYIATRNHIKKIETIFIQLTSSCNLHCKYCYAYRDESPQKLSSQQVNEILNTLSLRGSSVIIFSGGEPTLDNNLPEYIRTAYNLNHKPGIATNGVFLPESLLEAIVDCGAFIQFSLDTLDHKTFNSLCGLDRLNNILDNINRVLHAGIEPTLSFTVTQINFTDLTSIVEFALSKGITHLHVGNLVNSGRASCYRGLSGVSLYDLWDILYPIQIDYYEYIGIDLVEEFILPLATGVERHIFCAPMEGKGVEVTSSGRVVACGMMSGGWFTYGELNKNRFEKILEKVELNENCLDTSKLVDCQKCEAHFVCGCGCRAIAFINSGNPYGTHPHCNDVRKILTKVRKDMVSGKLDAYINFLKNLPSEKMSNSRYF
ncbi:MAG TPA: radical SAM protein [Methanosarcina sp.]|jgi:radical SAM protein with 4Fe4S-binding SPASM domain|nr:radical SAM protein [Methanosarcina sp.]